MPILFNKEENIFNIQSKNLSFIIGIYKDKLPVLIHYGKRVDSTYSIEKMLNHPLKCIHSQSAANVDFDKEITTDTVMCAYPTYGNTDLKTPAISVTNFDGTMCSNFYFKSFEIIKGKKALDGLPSVYCESEDDVETLCLCLYDSQSKLNLTISYSVFYDFDIICQSAKLENEGENPVKINSIMSASVDMEDAEFDFISLYGMWAMECQIQRTPLLNGQISVDSKRGNSSHFHNPFFALARKNTTEDMGEVYGFCLEYSGNFIARAENNALGVCRANIGINPFGFGWKLEKGESFTTPEAIMTYSDQGIGKMSDNFHNIIRKRICRGKYRDEKRPVLLNNWEATYFNFDEEKLLTIAKKAKTVGVELFVLDDGWFGKRDNDKCSMGDWFVNAKKLPNGIKGLAEKVNDIGLKFGLWFEPEAVSADSDLYRKHPDWCIHIKGRPLNEARNELLLDLSRDEVCEYVIEFLSDILENANVEYIKWDMNSSMNNVGNEVLSSDRQCEIPHRYILGLYKILEHLTNKFPNVLFEGCSSGGGRFDAAMLSYFPQIWASDCSDAIERLYIQHGTSLVYPPSCISAHVSASPNHQVHRETSIKTRGHVAMCGQFGYELDLNTLTDEEIEEVKWQINTYKRISQTIQKGHMYRLRSPFDGNTAAWEYVSEDKSEVVLMMASILRRGKNPYRHIKLRGLKEKTNYICENDSNVYDSSYLSSMGFVRFEYNDFETDLIILKEVK